MFIPADRVRPAVIAVLSILMMFVFCAGAAQAQTTAFTYQGRLSDAGSPATGQYDLEFRVFDAAVLGNQLATVQLDNVQVTGGVFTVRLDYGGVTPTLFNGAARYMEIGVRPGASSGAYTTLTPRQEVTSTPYAIQAANVQNTSGNSVVTALNNAATTTPISESKLDPNLVRFNPTTEQLSVGDANGTAAMINLRGGSTCCSGPGGHTPAWFKVFQNGSFVATGNLGIGTIPMSGKGYRTMWYTYKGAFRSGYADNEWDDANTGFFSWAGGSNSTASGLYSLSFGDTNFAESTSSIVFGSGNQVKGAAGFSAGAGNRVCDTYGVALGNNARSGGPFVNGKCDPDSFNIKGLAAVAIGYNVTADQDHSTAMGKFASNNGFSGVFIWSDGSATASADTFKSTANNEFAARATGGFRLRTNLAGTTGCNLPAGSGVFNCTSSKALKENFAGVGGEDLLARVRKVPVSTWNYIAEGKQVRHMGPFAEDFYGAFHLGTDNKSIGVLDIAGVNFAANKALELRTSELQKKVVEVDQLRNEVNALRAANAAMEQRLAAIEQAVKQNRPSGRARAATRRTR